MTRNRGCVAYLVDWAGGMSFVICRSNGGCVIRALGLQVINARRQEHALEKLSGWFSEQPDIYNTKKKPSRNEMWTVNQTLESYV